MIFYFGVNHINFLSIDLDILVLLLSVYVYYYIFISFFYTVFHYCILKEFST